MREEKEGNNDIGSRSNAERSGDTRTRLKRVLASTIPRVAVTVMTRAVRMIKTHDWQSGRNCTQYLPTKV